MTKSLAAVLLLLTLPGCVAAIGNKGGAFRDLPASARPLLQERVEAARRIMELRQQHVDQMKVQQQSGRIDQVTVNAAEIAVEEARIKWLEYRAELQALEVRKPE